MICTKCGARMMDTDRFCPKCGAKVIKERRCPECGAVLRDGTKFCHKCGSLVEGRESAHKVSRETPDSPTDEIKKSKSTTSHSSSKQNVPSKKRVSYREEEDWDDDDDWDDEDEGVDAITVLTAIVGCVLLVVVAVLGYHMYRQYVPKNYGDAAQESEDGETDIPGQELEEQQSLESISGPVSDHYVAVIKNVNVRDNPSTTDSNILKVAQEGETYPYAGRTEDGEWIKILLDDNSVGYVFHEYVNVND